MANSRFGSPKIILQTAKNYSSGFFAMQILEFFLPAIVWTGRHEIREEILIFGVSIAGFLHHYHFFIFDHENEVPAEKASGEWNTTSKVNHSKRSN